ncbi:hypothetical protein JAAARDRAFT_378150 [Jaapia argillacea MUCL 33604]|uniref:Uncharacterized protein n=1 Tax=Jaapia argillacea MUCL 33604 TaxID=933084 RepID=A0A067QLD9_9AGAM|nr:hypothetical protein JAAARDRAFT_378150 [Jaapia argillacea MUCL 33604]
MCIASGWRTCRAYTTSMPRTAIRGPRNRIIQGPTSLRRSQLPKTPNPIASSSIHSPSHSLRSLFHDFIDSDLLIVIKLSSINLAAIFCNNQRMLCQPHPFHAMALLRELWGSNASLTQVPTRDLHSSTSLFKKVEVICLSLIRTSPLIHILCAQSS